MQAVDSQLLISPLDSTKLFSEEGDEARQNQGNKRV